MCPGHCRAHRFEAKRQAGQNVDLCFVRVEEVIETLGTDGVALGEGGRKHDSPGQSPADRDEYGRFSF